MRRDLGQVRVDPARWRQADGLRRSARASRYPGLRRHEAAALLLAKTRGPPGRPERADERAPCVESARPAAARPRADRASRSRLRQSGPTAFRAHCPVRRRRDRPRGEGAHSVGLRLCLRPPRPTATVLHTGHAARRALARPVSTRRGPVDRPPALARLESDLLGDPRSPRRSCASSARWASRPPTFTWAVERGSRPCWPICVDDPRIGSTPRPRPWPSSWSKIGKIIDPYRDDWREDLRPDLRLGTFAPFFRASLSPIRDRLLTTLHLAATSTWPRPRNVPLFLRRIALATRFDAAFPYLRAIGTSWSRSTQRKAHAT